jgi:catechol 2,3-dioxygenase-like lactoylglutathione lyase family enzyme
MTEGVPPRCKVSCAAAEEERAMPITTLDHVNVLTTNIGRTVDFLTRVLGLEVGPRPPFRSPGAWLYAGGSAVVHVSQAGDTERTHVRETSPGGAPAAATEGVVDHVAFRCSGYAEMMDKLRALGIASHEANVPDRGLHQVFVDGPDHVSFELIFAAADVAGARETHASAR